MTAVPTIAQARGALAAATLSLDGILYEGTVAAAFSLLAAFIDATEAREAELLDDVRALCAQRAQIADDINELRAMLREVRAGTETFSEPGR